MASLHDVADFFIESAVTRGDEPMTNMRLQKMVYYAQAWHLQRHGVPLFNEPLEAWHFGPVVSSLYQEYKAHRDEPITEIHPSYRVENFTIDELTTLVDVYHEYNQFTTSALVGKSHRKVEPWSKTEQGRIIDLGQIRKDFDALPRLKSIDEDPSLFDGVPVVDRFPKEFINDPV